MEHIKGLDHLVFLVRDLKTGVAQLKRLGFNISARGYHDGLQTANHTIIFGRDYMELIMVCNPCKENESFSRALQKRQGLGYLVFATDDADELCAELSSAGIGVIGPTDFSREVIRAEGKCEASFRIVRVPPDSADGALFFYCQHNTPQLVWLPELSTHENRVTKILSVTLVAETVEEQVEALEQNIGVWPKTETEFGVVLQIESSELLVQTPAAYSEEYTFSSKIIDSQPPFYGAVTLAVDNIAETKKTLAKNGVAFSQRDDVSIIIDQQEDLGIFLTFIQLPTASIS